MTDVVADTLKWLREMGYQGVDLPTGVTGSIKSCPIAIALTRALGESILFTGKAWCRQSSESVGYEVPSYVQTFAKLFDEGKLPQYDERTVRRAARLAIQLNRGALERLS